MNLGELQDQAIAEGIENFNYNVKEFGLELARKITPKSVFVVVNNYIANYEEG